MRNIEFTPEELEILCEVLQHNLSEIGVEVTHTDTREFKVMLKRRREILEHILAKLPSVPVGA